MLMGCRFRSYIETEGIAYPISSFDVDTTPLVCPLVFVHMFVGYTEDIEAKASGSSTSGARGCSKHKIPIRGIVMLGRGRIFAAIVKSCS